MRRNYSRCCGTGLGFTITDDTDTDEIGLVHDSAERDTESISQFTTFVDGTRGLGIDVTEWAIKLKILTERVTLRTWGSRLEH